MSLKEITKAIEELTKAVLLLRPDPVIVNLSPSGRKNFDAVHSILKASGQPVSKSNALRFRKNTKHCFDSFK